MTFTATCLHCDHPVVDAQPQLGSAEVRAMQHHLLRRCQPDEPTYEELGKLLLHFRVLMKD